MSKIAYLFAEVNRPLYRSSGHSIHIREVCRALSAIGQDVFVLAALRGHEGSPNGVRVREIAPRVASLLGRRPRVRGAGRPGSRAVDAAPKVGAADAMPPSLKPSALAHDLIRVVWSKAWDAYFYRRARKELSRERPDFLYERYVRGASAGARLARTLHLPFIVEMNTSFTFPGEWWYHHSPLLPWFVKREERRLTETADRVIVVSTHLRDYLVSEGVPEEKLVVMFNGADVERFRPDAGAAAQIRAKHGLEDRLVIGFSGSLKPWHGVDVLIRSFRRTLADIPEGRLVIVGDGPLRASLELIARNEGVSDGIVFTGSVAHDDVPAYIAAMDIAVCPAPRLPNVHLSPIKLFEYMAAERPVIAAGYSDIPKVVDDHRNGVLVQPGNEAELARAILELGADAHLRSRLGREARRTVEESYTWHRNADRIVALFNEIRSHRAAVAVDEAR
jgi:glycosyltransferase involved in cell wall biosynthesis